jgi:sulfur carrier protein ThiS
MNIQVRLLSTLRTYSTTGADPLDLDVPQDARVSSALDILAIPPHIPKIVLLNGRHAREDQTLEEGDVLTLFPPVEGG